MNKQRIFYILLGLLAIFAILLYLSFQWNKDIVDDYYKENRRVPEKDVHLVEEPELASKEVELIGYYTTYEKFSGYEEDLVKCDAFVVSGGDDDVINVLKKRITDFGNGVNILNQNGNLVINLDWESFSSQEKEMFLKSDINTLVKILASPKPLLHMDVEPCFSVFNISFPSFSNTQQKQVVVDQKIDESFDRGYSRDVMIRSISNFRFNAELHYDNKLSYLGVCSLGSFIILETYNHGAYDFMETALSYPKISSLDGFTCYESEDKFALSLKVVNLDGEYSYKCLDSTGDFVDGVANQEDIVCSNL